MRAILIRIGIDHSYGGANAPIHPRTGGFFYIPIPESANSFHPDCERRYEEVIEPLARFCKDCRTSETSPLTRIEKLRHRPMHLDPDFQHLTYGTMVAGADRSFAR